MTTVPERERIDTRPGVKIGIGIGLIGVNGANGLIEVVAEVIGEIGTEVIEVIEGAIDMMMRIGSHDAIGIYLMIAAGVAVVGEIESEAQRPRQRRKSLPRI